PASATTARPATELRETARRGRLAWSRPLVNVCSPFGRVTACAGSDRTEGQHHVVTTEAEGVVQRGDRALGECPCLGADDVGVRLRVQVLEVDGRRRGAVVQRED